MLEPLLHPATVAVIGASRDPGKVGHAILANLQAGGFAGRLVPVNPAAKEILGLPCVPDLAALGEPVDLAVIAVPRDAVKPVVEGAVRSGARSLVIVSAGFKEADAKGAELERDIARICHARSVRLLGPNCLGLINTQHRLNATFARQAPREGCVSVVSQSGALCATILDWAASRHLGLAKLFSMGNKADLDENDLLAVLAEDDATRVIVGYLESLSSGDEFMKTAEATASRKPVVILKVGSTTAGVRAASSHTGALAGDEEIAYGAAFKRSGIIRAEGFEELFDIATALAMQPLPGGRRVAVITNAGGPGIMAADAVEHAGMRVAPLSRATADSLKERLPAAASVSNPIDVLGDADPERYALAVDAAQADEGVDAIIVILTPQAMTRPAETARAIARGGRRDKPVLAVFMGGEGVMPGRDELAAASLPDYSSPKRAVAALKAMCDYAAWRKRPPRVVTRFPVNRRRVERILSRNLRLGRTTIIDQDAKDILRAYDFGVPESGFAANADEAVETAERIGYPVAMKIASQDILHKTDLGGVKLDLFSPAQVRDAYDLMMLRIGRRLPDAHLDGVWIEQMCRGREVILGMTRDPQFGPMLMFGLGGIFVEVMKDVAFYLAPITASEAIQMLKSTRSYELLTGARQQDKVDLDAIASGLQRISQLATDFPSVQELDINPFMVGEPGTEPLVADARFTLRSQGGDKP